MGPSAATSSAGAPWRRAAARVAAGGLLAALVLLWGAAPAALAAAPPVHTLHLQLYALDSPELRYQGLRTIAEQDGRVTVVTDYTLPSGAPVQRTEAVYEAATLAPVSYKLLDARSGETETLERSGDGYRLAYRAKAAAEESSATLPRAPKQVFTATVEPLILRSWERLAAGARVSFRLLVPSRQDSYGFRIQRDDASPLRQPGTMVVRMEPDSWLVRRLVDPLFFVLETQAPHRLREFRGRASIKTDAGADQDLRITYSE